jgi:hypothetical protein
MLVAYLFFIIAAARARARKFLWSEISAVAAAAAAPADEIYGNLFHQRNVKSISSFFLIIVMERSERER